LPLVLRFEHGFVMECCDKLGSFDLPIGVAEQDVMVFGTRVDILRQMVERNLPKQNQNLASWWEVKASHRAASISALFREGNSLHCCVPVDPDPPYTSKRIP
jgi:hypothetical protein